MKQFSILALFLLLISSNSIHSQSKQSRKVILLDKNWKFINTEVTSAMTPDLDISNWQTVTIPHDWAISGEFDENNDIQLTKVIEDGEKAKKVQTGRTGGLPHVGIGWYRKTIDIPSNWKSKKVAIEFDGAMSHAKVYLNGEYLGEWPYGYASFGFDMTDKIKFGKQNTIAVRLENFSDASRWYPGAGIYRNVRVVVTNPTHIAKWGTYITTPDIESGKGTVNIKTTISRGNISTNKLKLVTEILDANNKIVASMNSPINGSETIGQNLLVKNPELWHPEKPSTYNVHSKLLDGKKEIDNYKTTFGFRYFEFTSDKGFFLNGDRYQLNGVCMHHDLGPLGSAVNYSALKRQLTILKEMGCNSIRTSHNPPTPEYLDLADEMGFIIIDEAFDEWKHPKVENGYNKLWDKWAEKDLVAFIHRDRNHPSVIMWSIGNEIREQGMSDGGQYGQFLVDICKREDPTRPTTAGFNNWKGAISSGLAAVVDVPGWNYKPQLYSRIHEEHQEWKMYGSETASTVSSRGEYFLPAKQGKNIRHTSYHCSSYDIESPGWGCPPDFEFSSQDENKFIAGEYVWTGFDYLGEPTPYKKEWPARSSYFGIIDLCGFPKDRFYLYQSKWTDKEVLHLLPHWNWEGKEGEIIPVHCYTNFEKAELFLNGKSLGIQEKNPDELLKKYRLIWNVPYEAGELKVVALNDSNQPVKEAFVKTAGEPSKIDLSTKYKTIAADGKEISFVTVSVVDKNGILCPRASNKIDFKVEGKGSIKAVGNGDQTSLESFIEPTRKVFNGKCMVYVQSTEKAGEIVLKAESEGLESEEIMIKSNNFSAFYKSTR